MWFFFALLAVMAPPVASVRVTNLHDQGTAPRTMVVEGRCKPLSMVEVRAEFPASRLPGYEALHDGIDTAHTTADASGKFRAKLDLTMVPEHSPVCVYAGTSPAWNYGQAARLTVRLQDAN